jgi:RNA recognition motif-containing protein
VCQMSVPARSLHVRFFNEKASFDLVTRLFGVFGRVERVRFLRDHAYVDYANCYDAYLAREYLDGKSLNGGVIQVTECSEPAATTCRPPLAKLSSNYQSGSAGLTSNTPRSAAYGVFDNNLMTEYLSRPMKSPLGNFDLNCKSTPAPSVSQGDGTPRKVGYDASLRRL